MTVKPKAELLRCNPTICLYAVYGNADRPLDALWSVQPYEWKFFPFSPFAPRYTPLPSAFSFSALPAHRIHDHKTEQIVHQMQILKFHTKTPARLPGQIIKPGTCILDSWLYNSALISYAMKVFSFHSMDGHAARCIINLSFPA